MYSGLRGITGCDGECGDCAFSCEAAMIADASTNSEPQDDIDIENILANMSNNAEELDWDDLPF